MYFWSSCSLRSSVKSRRRRPGLFQSDTIFFKSSVFFAGFSNVTYSQAVGVLRGVPTPSSSLWSAIRKSICKSKWKLLSTQRSKALWVTGAVSEHAVTLMVWKAFVCRRLSQKAILLLPHPPPSPPHALHWGNNKRVTALSWPGVGTLWACCRVSACE